MPLLMPIAFTTNVNTTAFLSIDFSGNLINSYRKKVMEKKVYFIQLNKKGCFNLMDVQI